MPTWVWRDVQSDFFIIIFYAIVFETQGEHAESNPRPSEEGVSFYHVFYHVFNVGACTKEQH